MIKAIVVPLLVASLLGPRGTTKAVGFRPIILKPSWSEPGNYPYPTRIALEIPAMRNPSESTESSLTSTKAPLTGSKGWKDKGLQEGSALRKKMMIQLLKKRMNTKKRGYGEVMVADLLNYPENNNNFSEEETIEETDDLSWTWLWQAVLRSL